MTVRVSKPAFNIRDALSALKRKIGIKGAELMSAETAADVHALINPVMFRNRLINGNMRIWQRGTSFGSLGNPYTSSSAYSADRWHTSQYQATNVTVSQVTSTGLSGFPYAIRVQKPNTATAGNGIWLNQSIESSNCYDLAGQTVTLSFYLRTGATFTSPTVDYGVAFQATDSSADYGMDYNYFRNGVNFSMVSKSMPVGSGWTYVTQTFQVPATCYQLGVFFGFYPVGTAGASDYIEVTGVQLEKGSAATPFEFRPYGTELALCQRYYFKYGTTTSYGPYGMGHGVNSTAARFTIKTPQTMRAQPSISFSASSGFQVGWLNTLSAIGAAEFGVDNFSVDGNTTGLSAFGAYMLTSAANTTSYISVSAEL